jgi:hypothetical protein
MTTEPTVADLVAAEPDPGGLFDRLATIIATVAEDGVEVTVNLEGRIVALTLTPEALARGGKQLADDIARLATWAAGTALAEGLATVAPFAGEELTAELAAIVAVPDAEPPARRAPDDEVDYSTIESWAVSP